MYRLVVYIVRISYIALCKVDQVDFDRWCVIKNRLNFVLNRKIMQWLSSNSSLRYAHNDQFALDVVVESALIHYKQRASIYQLSSRFPKFGRSVFVYLSILRLFVKLLSRLLREFFLVSRVYKAQFSIKDKVDVSLNFPSNSFNTIRDSRSKNCYSFGEYLAFYYPNTTILSVGEYVRHSQKKDAKVSDGRVLKTCRKRPEKKTDWLLFFYRSLRLVGALLFKERNRPKGLFPKLVYIRKYIYQFNFINMIEDLGLDINNIKTFFIMPFEDIGLLKYDSHISEKISSFNYSQNVLILPAPDLGEIAGHVKFLKYIPLHALTLSGKACGFISLHDNINTMKNTLNYQFDLNLPVYDPSPERESPIMLGYEVSDFSNEIKEGFLGKKFVAIFDLPPESQNHAMSRAITGDMVCNSTIVENFILDAIKVPISAGFFVIVKPKYSVSNYDDNYTRLLNKLKEQYGDRLVIADPYLNMKAIVDCSCASISMPYTSTKLIFEDNNIPSIFYIPEEYESVFRKNFSDDIVFGKERLENFIFNL